MRICFLLLLLFCTNSFAQTQLSDWQNVMNLSINTDVSIKTKQKTYQGLINKVELDSLQLYSSEPAMPGRKWVYRILMRNEILEIRMNRRTISGIVGGAIGAGIGVSTGAIIESQSRSNENKGLLTAILGIVPGLIGSAIGHSHPFIKGKTIYKSP